MATTYKSVLEGADELKAVLAEVPDRVQNRVFRFAGRKVSKAVADRERTLTPRRRIYDRSFIGPRGDHLADRVTSVQRVYRASNTTVNIVGPMSGGQGRIAHLVEDGTAQRATNHKTKYKTLNGGLVWRNKKVRTASGGYRTVREQVRKTTRKSIGSFHTGGVALNRGRMPAFHPLAKAVAQTPVNDIFETELRKGLQRILDRS